MKIKEGETEEAKSLNDLNHKFETVSERCQRLEDVVNDLIVQNQKVLDSNKFINMELFNSRKNQDNKLDKLIFFIMSFMGNSNNSHNGKLDNSKMKNDLSKLLSQNQIEENGHQVIPNKNRDVQKGLNDFLNKIHREKLFKVGSEQVNGLFRHPI